MFHYPFIWKLGLCCSLNKITASLRQAVNTTWVMTMLPVYSGSHVPVNGRVRWVFRVIIHSDNRKCIRVEAAWGFFIRCSRIRWRWLTLSQSNGVWADAVFDDSSLPSLVLAASPDPLLLQQTQTHTHMLVLQTWHRLRVISCRLPPTLSLLVPAQTSAFSQLVRPDCASCVTLWNMVKWAPAFPSPDKYR